MCQKLAPGAEKDDFVCDLCNRYKASLNGAKGLDGRPQSPQIIKLWVSDPSPVKSLAEERVADFPDPLSQVPGKSVPMDI